MCDVMLFHPVGVAIPLKSRHANNIGIRFDLTIHLPCRKTLTLSIPYLNFCEVLLSFILIQNQHVMNKHNLFDL